jgi:hypothetical protein
MPSEEPVPNEQTASAATFVPWWRKPGWVTALTSIVAATIPVTTAVCGNIQKDRELAMQAATQRHDAAMEELKLKHSIQIDFLDRLKNDSERLRTLRMVEATTDDDNMKRWASQEKGIVETDVAALKQQIEEKTAKVEEAQRKTDGLNIKDGEGARLVAEARKQQAELDRLRAQVVGVPVEADVAACESARESCIGNARPLFPRDTQECIEAAAECVASAKSVHGVVR